MWLRGGGRLISPAEKDLTTDSNDSGKQGHGVLLGLSACTIITKVTKKPNNRVLPGVLLVGCNVFFAVHNFEGAVV